jgi:AraC family transcriptional regulator
MVCPRCINSVSGILTDMDLPVSTLELGLAELKRTLSSNELEVLDRQLHEKGFELIFDRETELVNLVKSTIINYIEHIEAEKNYQKLSLFVSDNTNYNYSYLSKVFSDQTGDTIESYLIKMKIERVKELLSFRKWTLSEIAWKLKYSSVQYLSNQFKKITGVTVTEYLEKKSIPRKTLDQL